MCLSSPFGCFIAPIRFIFIPFKTALSAVVDDLSNLYFNICVNHSGVNNNVHRQKLRKALILSVVND